MNSLVLSLHTLALDLRRSFAGCLCAVLLWGTGGTMAAPSQEPPSPPGASETITTPTLLSRLAAASPSSPEERALLVELRLEVLKRIVVGDPSIGPQPALAFVSSTVSEAEKAYGAQSIRLVPVLRDAAQVLLRLGRVAAAVTLLERAAKISSAAIGADDPANRFVLIDLALAYKRAGSRQKAAAAQKRADDLEQIAAATTAGDTTLGSESGNAGASHQTVPVFFQTTRVLTGRRDPTSMFGTARDTKVHYGISYVSVPTKRAIGTIPHPSYFRLEFNANPARHVILKEVVRQDSQADFWKVMRSRLSNSVRKEVLVYIHGFNQSFQNSVETAATLSADLEIDGAVVAFSWPSRNNLLLYTADIDEATARENRVALRDLLTDVAASTNAQTVHVIAHSMGNRVLLEALSLMRPGNRTPAVDRVVFASPDMESKDFSSVVGTVSHLAGRMTLYAAAGDLALEVSDALRGVVRSGRAARAGDRDGGVLPTSYLEVVDTSKGKSDLLGHANFAYLARDDLRALIWFGLSAEKRCVLVGPGPAGWLYDPKPPCLSDAFATAVLYLRRLANRDLAILTLESIGDAEARAALSVLRAISSTRK